VKAKIFQLGQDLAVGKFLGFLGGLGELPLGPPIGIVMITKKKDEKGADGEGEF
jgi:hypothetical protein